MARRSLALNTEIEFVSMTDATGDYDVSVGTTYCEMKRLESRDDENETDKFSLTRYKARIRVPGNFTPLASHRANCKLRRENTTRQFRIVGIGEPDLRGHWLDILLEDAQRDN